MTHAEMIGQGRKEHVRLAVCTGKLEPLHTRRHWAKGTAEHLFQCQECGAVLGLVGENVEWSMSAASWGSLGIL
ncbi:MAG: hypothetical protein NVSMB9_34400 [Isosphaeraceae bacterium]